MYLVATIRRAKPSLILLGAMSITLMWAASAKAGTTITQTPGVCPVLIAQPGEYDLAGDVGPCPLFTNGIEILASGVTLHLDGHTISAVGCSGDNTGISVNSVLSLTQIGRAHV